jgi:leucyl-tRNA synthetase
MRAQLKKLGLSYDWTREFMTCDPSYYRWEQWLFTKLVEKGLAYRKTSWVNWDPVDQTILANEQVIQGRGWRSGALVERRAIPQWFLKITDYADRLLQDLDYLSHWPESVKTMQRRWIGRSEGIIVQFSILDNPNQTALEVFTTRVDTLMGVSYLAISPEHILAHQAAAQDTTIQVFIDQCRTLPTAEAAIATQEKLGIFTGWYAQHPITQAILPIWIANFVTMDYGTGAVMAVPAHDSRDFEFAQRYCLPIQVVITENGDAISADLKKAYTGTGYLVNSGLFTGLTTEAAKPAIKDYLVKHSKGYPKVHYRLRDWGVSRQRYWGTPIPIIYCEHCGTVPVPAKDLPVVLPERIDFSRAAPLSHLQAFYQTTCPRCHRAARRETDTFDTFIESSWYFIRFTSLQTENMLETQAQSWLPVDHYIGGIEHAVLHLLYARFFYKVLHDLDLLQTDPTQTQEPFQSLLTQGMVLKEGVKMSKSKGNVVDPESLIEKYGVDAIRLFILFAAPPDQSLEWSDEGLSGAVRFLKRLWHFIQENTAILVDSSSDTPFFNSQQKEIRAQIYQLLQSARKDYDRYQFNTVIASCMKFLNILQDAAEKYQTAKPTETLGWQLMLQEGTHILLRLLAPLAPHITHVLWKKLNLPDSILDASWPKVLDSALEKENRPVVVQVNGKRRAILSVKTDMDIEKIQEAALQTHAIQPFIKEVNIKKVIVVTPKNQEALLINIVTSPLPIS